MLSVNPQPSPSDKGVEVPMSQSHVALAPQRLRPPSRFVIGEGGDGRWAALSEDGRAGGLFKKAKEALRYARVQAGSQPCEVRFAADPLELVFAAARPDRNDAARSGAQSLPSACAQSTPREDRRGGAGRE